jgi:hypothetical protein
MGTEKLACRELSATDLHATRACISEEAIDAARARSQSFSFRVDASGQRADNQRQWCGDSEMLALVCEQA